VATPTDYRAAVRFRYKVKGERGPTAWYNPGDKVPAKVAKEVDDRCVLQDPGGMGNYPSQKGIDEIAGWCLEKQANDDEFRARLEYARQIEGEGQRRKGMLAFLDDHLATLDEEEAAAEEGEGAEGKGE